MWLFDDAATILEALRATEPQQLVQLRAEVVGHRPQHRPRSAKCR